MISVGIVGASGYTGEELATILLGHPHAKITVLTSRTHAGEKVNDVFSLPSDINTTFLEPTTENLKDCDVVFFATPNGVAMKMAKELLNNNIRIIDISADFRLDDYKIWEKWYKGEHCAKELLKESVYGLPEIPNQKDKIKTAKIVANPGCYPTAALLALLPICSSLEKQKIVIDAKSGISGAGRNLDSKKLFSTDEENFQAYAVRDHRHYPEILQGLQKYNDNLDILFVPHLSSMIRGIFSTTYLKYKYTSIEDLNKKYEEFYKDSHFIEVTDVNSFPKVSDVNKTNNCKISLHAIQESDDEINLIVFSVIDNLVKGASGQAIQNMNIMFNLDETSGLI